MGVTIILLNILIAFLSNEFSRMEDQQQINTLKKKASLILDVELIFKLFRELFRKPNNLNKENLRNGKRDQSKRNTDSKKMLFLMKKKSRASEFESQGFEKEVLDSLKHVVSKIDSLEERFEKFLIEKQ